MRLVTPTTVASATLHGPDQPEAVSLPVRNTNGRAQVEVPRVPIYRVIEMQFSNDGLDWTDWEAYSAYKPWELEASNATELGVKTVYARVKNTAGNVSAVFSDTIELKDYRAPEGAILIDNGSEITNFNK